MSQVDVVGQLDAAAEHGENVRARLLIRHAAVNPRVQTTRAKQCGVEQVRPRRGRQLTCVVV